MRNCRTKSTWSFAQASTSPRAAAASKKNPSFSNISQKIWSPQLSARGLPGAKPLLAATTTKVTKETRKIYLWSRAFVVPEVLSRYATYFRAFLETKHPTQKRESVTLSQVVTFSLSRAASLECGAAKETTSIAGAQKARAPRK